MMPRQDIDYDFEDFGMSEDDLALKYAETQQHPVHNEATWLAYKAMPTRDVKLDYWPWVVRQIQKDDDDFPSNVPEPTAEAFQEQLTEQQAADVELVSVDSIDQFAAMVAHWHGNKIAMLEHFLKMPPGQEGTLQLEGEPAVVVKLEGEAYNGFRLGLVTALIQISNLPFAVTVSEAPDAAPDADAPKH